MPSQRAPQAPALDPLYATHTLCAPSVCLQIPLYTGYPDPVRFLARVTAKGADWLRLDRPLPVRVDLRWRPEIHK